MFAFYRLLLPYYLPPRDPSNRTLLAIKSSSSSWLFSPLTFNLTWLNKSKKLKITYIENLSRIWSHNFPTTNYTSHTASNSKLTTEFSAIYSCPFQLTHLRPSILNIFGNLSNPKFEGHWLIRWFTHLRENADSHLGHLYFLSPVCSFMWRSRLRLCLNNREQNSQRNGMKSTCVWNQNKKTKN